MIILKSLFLNVNKHILLLIGILILGFFLRFYHITELPAGFFCDEASIGYNAHSILSTGKDEYGVFYPIFFQSFGDYRPPLTIYSTIPFIGLFGLNELSIRLPSVLYGLITIIVMYFIGKEISSNRNSSFGLLVAFITATMPWLIHYNRTGFEFTIYVTFFTITILLLLKTIHNKSFIIPAFILSALTIYTYQPAKLLIPLLLLGFLFIHKKTYIFHKKYTVVSLLSFFMLSIPFILSFTNGQALARFNMVSVFSADLSFEQSVLRIIQNYLIQLSPSYFISGEPTFITRHFVKGLTPLLITTLPFIFVGLIHIFLAIKINKSAQLLIYWILLYPIAGAVTADAPFTSRSIIGAPLFAILISLGIKITVLYIKRFIHNYILTSIIIFLILLNLISYSKFYFIQYPLYSSNYWGWQYGPKEIMQYFLTTKDTYDDLYMSGEFNGSDIFIKFYDPNNLCQFKCKIGDFWRDPQIYNPQRKQLFSLSPEYLQKSKFSNKFITKKIIKYPNGNIAFYIGEIVQ